MVNLKGNNITHYCTDTPYQCFLYSSIGLARIDVAVLIRDEKARNSLRTQVHILYHLEQD